MLRDKIIEVLKTIEDPELFLDIWFLGLIYNIDISEAGDVIIEMTFTSPMCPYGPSLAESVKQGVSQVEGVKSFELKIVFAPPWQPSEEVKGMLGML